MKPYRSYNSFERFGEKLRIALLLLLLGQIFYLNISSVKIPIPSLIVDKIFNDFFTIPSTISIRTHGSYLSGFSNIQISKIEFAQENEVFAKLEGLEVDLNPKFLADNNEAAFRIFSFQQSSLISNQNSKNYLLGKTLS